MLLAQVCLLTVFTTIFYVWWKRKKFEEFGEEKPMKDGLNVVKVVTKVVGIESKDLYAALLSVLTPFKLEVTKYIKFWVGPFLVFTPYKPEDIQIILNSEECQNKPAMFYSGAFLYGLLTMNGDEYKAHRKAIKPIFFPKSLRSFLPKVEDVMNKFLDDFDSKLKPEAFDMWHHTTDFAFNSILTTMFGSKLEEKHRLKFLNDVEVFADLVAERMFKPWLYIDTFFKMTKFTKELAERRKSVNDFVKILVEDHEKEYQKTKSTAFTTSKPFIDHVYSLRDTITFDQTLQEIAAFLEAGFDTSGKGIPATLLLLAMNQHEQDKVLAEIESVLLSTNDEIDEEKLGKLNYLDLVIKESLRLVPLGIITARQCSADVRLTECTIPSGTFIFLMALEVHREKHLWGEDAMEFKPERFLEENIKKVHPYAYIPFLNGPRICPGMKYAQMAMKIFLSRFLMKYRVTTELKYEELDFEMKVTVAFRQGFTMKVEPR